MRSDRVLVTGANGFVGQHLCEHLLKSGREVIPCLRQGHGAVSDGAVGGLRPAHIQHLNDSSRWAELLPGVDTVVHLAARVHVMRDQAANPLAEFRRINVEGTATLATEAAKAGVRRFIYLSSIKVNGEATDTGAFRADDEPGYLDPYGQSKWEAEQRLAEIAAMSSMGWVVVRPTLVYGPGVRGNFFSLLRYVNRGMPLPLANVRNKRSLVSVYNLVDLLEKVIDHPLAAGQAFLVKDPEDLSTAELISRMAASFGRRPRLISVPTSVLAGAGAVFQQKKAIQRLLGSLVVDTEKTQKVLGWQAPMPMDSALAQTCNWYQTIAASGSVPQ